jgi:tetratricopeptide (TPR) repeat protein
MPVRISRFRWAARWPWDDRPWIAPHLPAPPSVAALAGHHDPAMGAIDASVSAGPIEARLETALLAGRYDEARTIYAADRARFPDRWGQTRIGAMRAFAERLFQAGHTAAALEMARIQTETYPESAAVWTTLGIGYLLSGDRAQAIRQFQKSLAVDPDHEPAKRWLEHAMSD